MAEDLEANKQLERYARAIARNLLQRYNLAHDGAWHEDITQSLLLAGCQVWRDTGDEAKAQHRMSSRAKNRDGPEQGPRCLVETQRPPFRTVAGE